VSRWLWTAGAALVALGLLAHLFGWDALLSVPVAAVETVRSSPETYGLVALGLLLMVLARLFGSRRRRD
jgi:MYXO-CTERM domain-containing protein